MSILAFAARVIPMIKFVVEVALAASVAVVALGVFNDLDHRINDEVNSRPPRGSVGVIEFGDRWPFTVDSGQLICDKPNRALFQTGGKTYGINGAAVQYGFEPVDSIWRNDPKIYGAKVNIGPMINRALALC